VLFLAHEKVSAMNAKRFSHINGEKRSFKFQTVFRFYYLLFSLAGTLKTKIEVKFKLKIKVVVIAGKKCKIEKLSGETYLCQS